MCQTPHQKAAHGYIDPGFFASGQHFIVFGQPTPGGKPSEGPLHDPAPFEDMKAGGNGWRFLSRSHPDIAHPSPPMLDDLDVPSEALFDPRLQIALFVGAICPDELEPRKDALKRLEKKLASLMILDVGLMNKQMHDQAIGVNKHVPDASFHALAAVIAAPPPISLVFPDWLSRIAADGVGSRPCFTRTCSRKLSCICCQVPSWRHVRK